MNNIVPGAFTNYASAWCYDNIAVINSAWRIRGKFLEMPNKIVIIIACKGDLAMLMTESTIGWAHIGNGGSPDEPTLKE